MAYVVFDEARAQLGLSRNHLALIINKGLLVCKRIYTGDMRNGANLFIDQAEIDNFKANQLTTYIEEFGCGGCKSASTESVKYPPCKNFGGSRCFSNDENLTQNVILIT